MRINQHDILGICRANTNLFDSPIDQVWSEPQACDSRQFILRQPEPWPLGSVPAAPSSLFASSPPLTLLSGHALWVAQGVHPFLGFPLRPDSTFLCQGFWICARPTVPNSAAIAWFPPATSNYWQVFLRRLVCSSWSVNWFRRRVVIRWNLTWKTSLMPLLLVKVNW